MADPNTKTERSPPVDGFARRAEAAPRGLFREVLDYLRHSRKWWMSPILVALLIFGVLVVLSSSVAAPYIYALF